jgi:hypothetical protein
LQLIAIKGTKSKMQQRLMDLALAEQVIRQVCLSSRLGG